jgi:cell division protein FtsW (lipid II flippase)
MISPIISAIVFNAFLPAWFVWVAAMVIIGWRSFAFPLLGAIGALVVNATSGQLAHVLWGILKDYQKDRLILFLDPDKDPLGGGYHLIQSRIAIGAGGAWGRDCTTAPKLNCALFLNNIQTLFSQQLVKNSALSVACASLLPSGSSVCAW